MLLPRWTRPPPRLLHVYTSASLPRPLIAPQHLRTRPISSFRSSQVGCWPLKAPPSNQSLALRSPTAPGRRASISFPLSSPTRDAGGRRGFSSSTRRQDVFFVAVPAFKQGLLVLVRVGLILLPVYVSLAGLSPSHCPADLSHSAWRWGFFRRFPAQTRRLWQLPLLAVLAVIGLGLNQSPRTAR